MGNRTSCLATVPDTWDWICEQNAWSVVHFYNGFVVMYFSRSWLAVILVAYAFESFECVLSENYIQLAENCGDTLISDIVMAAIGALVGHILLDRMFYIPARLPPLAMAFHKPTKTWGTPCSREWWRALSNSDAYLWFKVSMEVLIILQVSWWGDSWHVATTPPDRFNYGFLLYTVAVPVGIFATMLINRGHAIWSSATNIRSGPDDAVCNPRQYTKGWITAGEYETWAQTWWPRAGVVLLFSFTLLGSMLYRYILTPAQLLIHITAALLIFWIGTSTRAHKQYLYIPQKDLQDALWSSKLPQTVRNRAEPSTWL